MFGICKYPFLIWLFFSMNGVIGNIWGMGKNFKVCGYVFYLFKSCKQTGCARRIYYTLLVGESGGKTWT